MSQRQADNQGLRVNVLTMIAARERQKQKFLEGFFIDVASIQNDRAATVPAAP